MAHGLQHVGAGELSREPEVRYVQRVHSEVVMMGDRIVPWRAWTVIATIISRYLGIPGKPVGVVVHSANPVLRGARRFAAGSDPVGLGPSGQRGYACRNVYENPVVEGDALQAGGNDLALLIHVLP